MRVLPLVGQALLQMENRFWLVQILVEHTGLSVGMGLVVEGSLHFTVLGLLRSDRYTCSNPQLLSPLPADNKQHSREAA